MRSRVRSSRLILVCFYQAKGSSLVPENFFVVVGGVNPSLRRENVPSCQKSMDLQNKIASMKNLFPLPSLPLILHTGKNTFSRARPTKIKLSQGQIYFQHWKEREVKGRLSQKREISHLNDQDTLISCSKCQKHERYSQSKARLDTNFLTLYGGIHRYPTLVWVYRASTCLPGKISV